MFAFRILAISATSIEALIIKGESKDGGLLILVFLILGSVRKGYLLTNNK